MFWACLFQTQISATFQFKLSAATAGTAAVGAIQPSKAIEKG